MYRRLLASLLALALAAAAFDQPSAAQSPEPLFYDLGAASAAAGMDRGPAASRAVVERIAVGIRLDLLFDAPGGPQPLVRLNVGDREWVARFQRLDVDGAGFRSWVGTIDGIQYGHVVFTERAGIVSGLIDAASVTYQVRTAQAGSYVLEQINAEQLGGDGEPLVGRGGPARPASDRFLAVADDAGTIDVLLLYTPNARTTAGGLSQIQAIASQVISDSNTIFTNSSVTPRFRLVGTSELAFVEAPTMSSDLTTLTDSATAQALRDLYRADVVQLLTKSPDGSLCGMGWLLDSLSSTDFDAYSVVDIQCVSQYSPTHEMGHNLGSHHAPEDGATGALFPYSYGYKDPVRGFRTVMASACSPSSCPRIPHFSNPLIFYNGGTTGATLQNNALSINNAAATAANWRQAGSGGGGGGGGGPTPPPVVWTPVVTVSGTVVTVTWPAPISGFAATSYQVEIVNTAGQAVAVVNVGAAQFFTSALPNGAYVVRVRGFGAGGATETSVDASFTVGATSPAGVPLPPRDLRAVVSGGFVTLTWNVDVGTPLPTTFIVDVGSAPGLSNLGSFDIGSVALRVVAPQPAPGTYYVRVRAMNAFGVSAPSNEVSVPISGIGTACASAPAAPTGLSATVSGTFVTLNWGQPLSASPVTGHVVEVGSSPGLANVLQIPTGPSTILSGNAAPGIYFVRVRALNSCGQSGVSNEVVVTVP